MKAVQTVSQTKATEYAGDEKPKFKVGDYLRVYAGTNEGHYFTVKDVRYNYDIQAFEYLYGGFLGCWHHERCLVDGRSRQGWHYDSKGYCDNPGRGY